MKINLWDPPKPYFDWKMGKFDEIDSAETRAGKFPLVPIGGLSGGSPVRGHGSEDSHRR